VILRPEELHDMFDHFGPGDDFETTSVARLAEYNPLQEAKDYLADSIFNEKTRTELLGKLHALGAGPTYQEEVTAALEAIGYEAEEDVTQTATVPLRVWLKIFGIFNKTLDPGSPFSKSTAKNLWVCARIPRNVGGDKVLI
jgi:hypothetical protein